MTVSLILHHTICPAVSIWGSYRYDFGRTHHRIRPHCNHGLIYVYVVMKCQNIHVQRAQKCKNIFSCK